MPNLKLLKIDNYENAITTANDKLTVRLLY